MMQRMMRCVIAVLAMAPMCGLAADEAAGPERLRVGVFPMTAAVMFDGDMPHGMSIDLWANVAKQLGTATEFVRLNSIEECLPAVRNGTIDVFLGPFAITEERERVVDFTHSVLHSGMRIAIRQRSGSGFLDALRGLVSWELLGVAGLLIGLAVFTGHVLWVFERRDNPEPFPRGYWRGVQEATWWSVSTMITGGCENKPISTTLGRVIAIAWMLGGIVLVASFTSVLTATMTADRVASAIQGPRDLQGREVACQRGAVSVQAVRQCGGVPQEYTTLDECLDAVSLGMAAAFVSENQSLMYAISQPGRSGFRLVGTVFDSFDYGLAVPTGSPLRERINAALLQMREDGSLDRIREQWLGKHE